MLLNRLLTEIEGGSVKDEASEKLTAGMQIIKLSISLIRSSGKVATGTYIDIRGPVEQQLVQPVYGLDHMWLV
jgi:hypothetical protein